MTLPEPISAFPLHWPMNHVRTSSRVPAPFGRRKGDRAGFRAITIAEARDALLHQVRLIGGSRPTISSNLEPRGDGLPRSQQRRLEDPGVAVYFFRGSQPLVFACDRWTTPECNLYAINLHLEALRGQERWCVGSLDQALLGYQLPSSERVRPWWEVLGVAQSATADQINVAYRDLVRLHHPDRGGDADRMAEINGAMRLAKNW